jgi:hypothetical protein
LKGLSRRRLSGCKSRRSLRIANSRGLSFMAITSPNLDSHRIYNYRTNVIRTVALTRLSASGLARLLCVYWNSVWGNRGFSRIAGHAQGTVSPPPPDKVMQVLVTRAINRRCSSKMPHSMRPRFAPIPRLRHGITCAFVPQSKCSRCIISWREKVRESARRPGRGKMPSAHPFIYAAGSFVRFRVEGQATSTMRESFFRA